MLTKRMLQTSLAIALTTATLLPLLACKHQPRRESNGQISIQLDPNWRLQPEDVGQLMFERRSGPSGGSHDLLNLRSHPDCTTHQDIATSEHAFAATSSNHGTSAHAFTLQTLSGSASCISSTPRLSDGTAPAEVLLCYLPAVDIAYTGAVFYQAEAVQMIRSLKTERPCVPQTK